MPCTVFGFQKAATEFVAADAEWERLMKIKPLPIEAWEASDACYRATKKLEQLFGCSPGNVQVNLMFAQLCERLLKQGKVDA